MQEYSISSIDAGGNYDNTLGVSWGLECGVMGEGLNENLRRIVETLSKKNEAKDLVRNDFGVEDGSEVLCLRCSKEFMFVFPQETWVGD